ncbi:hypothetical protein A3F27_01600 [Candidatus Kaiserbacteria bacterium RIFCSPHIGHO2_12_FULL_53_13]|uniref:Capsular biosynthesis protein n=1 Tax=Candidatus Kaiserbacteria bacterium RIFCSPHIGHO2_12_FULL_53_13 TaxID=1798502 RepID=A0A1F6E694_9BACT|nr:MAG: hypothetical protein A3F27_01600 [Candidatus Kaiserbacteria bacterium RIFCSPHIGHO2_12_FULL_53_13]OGG74746.1 MAG: hypothetical protein A3A37_01345 [Candidatus Kaiserbacteria bacterium RIFCSPLOWO2_01_FULL_52_36]
MKLFIIGLGSVIPEHVHVVEELAKQHEILYWLYIYDVAKSVDKARFPGTVFHDYRAALKGIHSENIDASRFEPWSKDDIVLFSAIESEIMSMIDKWYPDWPILKRKDFYYDLLCYWGGVLDQLNPDAILFADVPHQMFDFVLYEIAKRRGIKTIILDPVFRYDRLVTYRDYRAGNEALANWKQRARETKLNELAPETRGYYLEVSGSKDPSPAHFTEWNKVNSGLYKFRRHAMSLIPFIRDGSIIERGVMRIFKMLKSNVKDEYLALERPADLKKPYVYVPIHYQPELTTSPQGSVYVDQILMMKTLSAALPVDWELYIKEHPAQWMAHGGNFTSYRYRGIYEEMARLRNVRLVPVTTNTFTLIDNAKAIATATGTAAMEAILRGKNALIFGYPWFMHAPGMFRVSCVEDCRKAFARIMEEKRADEQDILNYLKVVEEVSFRGYTAGEGASVSTYDRKEAWQEILKAIEDELRK